MFKDYDKYLSTSLKVYIFVLVLVFILKLVGMDYFGLDINNSTINNINNFCLKYHLDYLWYFATLFVQLHLFFKIICENKKMIIYSFFVTVLLSLTQILLNNYKFPNYSYFIISVIVLSIIPMLVEKKFFIKKQIKYILLITFYQFISVTIRNINLKDKEWNFIIDSILNIDQLLLLAITYKIKMMKGECICGQVVSLSSLKKINLRKSLKKLQRNLHKFKRIPYIETYIGEFAENHPIGKYLITTNGHITACVDGYIIDTWNCTNKKIEYVWKVI